MMAGPLLMPFASRCLLRDDFYSPAMVQSNGGVIVASSIDRGISPTSTSARVTYEQTRNALINASQATVMMRFRAPAAWGGAARTWLGKYPDAANDNQFTIQSNVGGARMYVATAIADTGQSFGPTVPLAAGGAVYTVHWVYDGTLAVGSRGIVYVDGLPVATTISGVLPASMRSNSLPVTIFNRYGGSTLAPETDFVLYEVRVQKLAMSAAEVLDDARNFTFQKSVP